MGTAELALDYSQHASDEWEETVTERKTVPQDIALRNLMIEPFVPAETNHESSVAIRRLYRAPRKRLRRDVIKIGISDLAFFAFPTVALSLFVVGLMSLTFALIEKLPTLIVPSILATIGFAVLGVLASYLKRLMRRNMMR